MNGMWIIFWDAGAYSRRLYDRPKQVVKETEKLIKFSKSGGWPRQIDKAEVIAAFPTEEEASAALAVATTAYKAAYDAATPLLTDLEAKCRDAMVARTASARSALFAALPTPEEPQ